MNRINKGILILFFLAIQAVPGYSQYFKDKEKFHLGVDFGLNITRINGKELEDPSIKMGSVIGAYYRQQLGDNFQLLTEVAFSLRGSNFKHSQESFYSRVKFVYMDFPVNLFINTSGKEKDQHLVLGVEPAYLLQSEIYVNPDFVATYRNIGFKRFDMSGCVGYHFDFYYLGIQPEFKFGLLNINDNLNLPNVYPATGKMQTIRNFTFDIKVFF
ncbi:MAG: outer membrane beta-barrel protein [Bacteroidetes bacterium]|nr:outer membrane beta-barrel protein [Bacteroidota bacterium]